MTRYAGRMLPLLVLVGFGMWAQEAGGPRARHRGAQVRDFAAAPLPAMNGEKLTVKVQEVTYPPGGSSSIHSHPCPVVGYVVHGAVRMRVKGEAERTYNAGEIFYEAPNSVHLVSANASESEPATFIASFVCDRDTALTVPVAANTAGAHQ